MRTSREELSAAKRVCPVQISTTCFSLCFPPRLPFDRNANGSDAGIGWLWAWRMGLTTRTRREDSPWSPWVIERRRKKGTWADIPRFGSRFPFRTPPGGWVCLRVIPALEEIPPIASREHGTTLFLHRTAHFVLFFERRCARFSPPHCTSKKIVPVW